MKRKIANKRWETLSPSMLTALTAVAVAGLVVIVSYCMIFMLRFQPAFAPLIILLLSLVVAGASWLGANYAIKAALRPAIANGRTHAAIARYMGAGIGRLAQGDNEVRITIDLPSPYEGFGSGFNSIAQALQTACKDNEEMQSLLDAHIIALEANAVRLGERAHKLHERIVAELRLIDRLAEHDLAAALEIARHMLQGAGIAAGRNIDAADDLAKLALSLRDHGKEISPPVLKKPDIRPDIAA